MPVEPSTGSVGASSVGTPEVVSIIETRPMVVGPLRDGHANGHVLGGGGSVRGGRGIAGRGGIRRLRLAGAAGREHKAGGDGAKRGERLATGDAGVLEHGFSSHVVGVAEAPSRLWWVACVRPVMGAFRLAPAGLASDEVILACTPRLARPPPAPPRPPPLQVRQRKSDPCRSPHVRGTNLYPLATHSQLEHVASHPTDALASRGYNRRDARGIPTPGGNHGRACEARRERLHS